MNNYNYYVIIIIIVGDIYVVYIITDSDSGYKEMAQGLHIETTYQLYRDYLDNFRINKGRK